MIGAHELSIKADLSYRQVDFWTRSGLLTAIDSTPGSGTVREYPDDQLKIARIMSSLVKAGVLPRPARRIAGELIERGRSVVGDFVMTPCEVIDVHERRRQALEARRSG